MKKDIVHTCYGCPYYYRVNNDGEKEYLQPHSYRNCDIENTCDCDYFSNGGEPRKIKRNGE